MGGGPTLLPSDLVVCSAAATAYPADSGLQTEVWATTGVTAVARDIPLRVAAPITGELSCHGQAVAPVTVQFKEKTGCLFESKSEYDLVKQ